MSANQQQLEQGEKQLAAFQDKRPVRDFDQVLVAEH